MVFRTNFLPAKYGDCIWIQYGNENDLRNVLIDGGTGGTKKHIIEFIKTLPINQRVFELIVVTHVDRDHIEGILRLLEDESLNFEVSDFWFNGYKHLVENDFEEFGAEMGEDLSARIISHNIPWNKAFEGKAVVVSDDGDLPVIELSGGLSLTLLSPYREHLTDLKPKWIAEVIKAGLKPGYGGEEPIQDDNIEILGVTETPDINQLNQVEFHEDDSVANGSSIALLASFDGENVLLAGDAFPGTILRSLVRLFNEDKVPLSLTKLSHHASSHNTSPELIEKLDCKNYLVSTNGSIYKHPSQETLAWIIKRSERPHLYFNYKSPHNSMWDNSILRAQFKYQTYYPQDGSEGIIIDLK